MLLACVSRICPRADLSIKLEPRGKKLRAHSLLINAMQVRHFSDPGAGLGRVIHDHQMPTGFQGFKYGSVHLGAIDRRGRDVMIGQDECDHVQGR